MIVFHVFFVWLQMATHSTGKLESGLNLNTKELHKLNLYVTMTVSDTWKWYACCLGQEMTRLRVKAVIPPVKSSMAGHIMQKGVQFLAIRVMLLEDLGASYWWKC